MPNSPVERDDVGDDAAGETGNRGGNAVTMLPANFGMLPSASEASETPIGISVPIRPSPVRP